MVGCVKGLTIIIIIYYITLLLSIIYLYLKGAKACGNPFTSVLFNWFQILFQYYMIQAFISKNDKKWHIKILFNQHELKVNLLFYYDF